MKISVEDRAQDFLERFSVESAVQDPCVRISNNDLRRPLCEISVQAPVRAFTARFMYETSLQDLRSRSL